MSEKYELNDIWVLWYHSLNEKEWTKDTYTKIIEINSLEKFFYVYKSIPTFNKGMFFLMRKDIFPQWEDESNINGGYWSFKISKSLSDRSWFYLSCCCVGECLTKSISDMDDINGISFSPKINNCIIKILNKSSENNDSSTLTEKIDNLHPNTCQYKKHIENESEFVTN